MSDDIEREITRPIWCIHVGEPSKEFDSFTRKQAYMYGNHSCVIIYRKLCLNMASCQWGLAVWACATAKGTALENQTMVILLTDMKTRWFCVFAMILLIALELYCVCKLLTVSARRHSAARAIMKMLYIKMERTNPRVYVFLSARRQGSSIPMTWSNYYGLGAMVSALYH